MPGDLDLCLAFVDEHPADAAQVLERLPVGDVAPLLERMPPATAARVFDQMTAGAASECLVRLSPDRASAVVAELRTDLAAALLRRLDEASRGALLDRLPDAERSHVGAVLRYPEGTAGALMDPRVMSVADDVSAGEALARIRRSPRHVLYYLYVVDRTRRLVGVIDVSELMQARPGEPLANVMHHPVSRLSAGMARAAIVAHPGWRHFHALPVVDDASSLVGALRYQTFRRLEDDARTRERATDAVSAVFALGELYWLGLSGLLEGLAAIVKRMPPGDDTPEVTHGSL